MPDDEQAVWVLMTDYGPEGLSEPFVAFENQEIAERAKKMIDDAGGQTVRLCRVPIWTNI